MHPKFSANLSMLFGEETDFISRIKKASSAGFEAIEFLFPYGIGVEKIAEETEALDLQVALFNLHPGNIEKNEWGTLCNPDRIDYFRWSVEEALRVAKRLKCKKINAMFGKRMEVHSTKKQVDCAVKNLKWAAKIAEGYNIYLLIEPLNPFDFPDYFLHFTEQAIEVIQDVDHPLVGLQYDIYHGQMTEGNLINTIKRYLAYIRHIQIADVPGRHEPGTGEIRYSAIFLILNELAYEGYIGLEYRPLGTTEESLGWISDLFDTTKSPGACK